MEVRSKFPLLSQCGAERRRVEARRGARRVWSCRVRALKGAQRGGGSSPEKWGPRGWHPRA